MKDKNDNTLRVLKNNISSAEETLKNFGATNASIPSDLKEEIVDGKFDKNLLSLLESFDTDTNQIHKDVLQSTAEAISKQIIENIPLDEYEKL